MELHHRSSSRRMRTYPQSTGELLQSNLPSCFGVRGMTIFSMQILQTAQYFACTIYNKCHIITFSVTCKETRP